MAVGAIFAALNSMYSAVSVRAREIATLRAIGFGASAVVGSIIAESLLLTALGSILGIALVRIVFDGRSVHTAIGGGFPSQLVFDLSVDVYSILACAGIGVLIGLLGGALPAIRAARMEVATALRAF